MGRRTVQGPAQNPSGFASWVKQPYHQARRSQLVFQQAVSMIS